MRINQQAKLRICTLSVAIEEVPQRVGRQTHAVAVKAQSLSIGAHDGLIAGGGEHAGT